MKNRMLAVMMVWLVGGGVFAATVSVSVDPTCPQINFGVAELVKELKADGHDVTIRKPSDFYVQGTMSLEISDSSEYKKQFKVAPKPEGFSIRVTERLSQPAIVVVGGDPAGAMYGALELAEQVRIGSLKTVKDTDQNPYMALRGTKFNIPLDVRTPSYTDVCDAAQQNIGQMWEFDFWKAYIDALARHRYNYISLWNLHPFPSMVKVPDYPNVALADVKRSRTIRDQENYPLQGMGFCPPEVMKDLEILKKMSIEDKMDFWRKVMRYGKERNVDFYIVTWNIFVYGIDGKYGITDSFKNKTTADYFRKSVKQMFQTYPDLAGIGLTTGENMHGANFKAKEKWAFDTYGQGVLDAVKEQPGRKITFIHRQHQTGAQIIAKQFAPLIKNEDIEFIFSFKYAKAHVFSCTEQPYHRSFVKDLGQMKTIWTLRNDDNFYYRWGAPDFVREFVQNIPHDVSRGYYYGSDQYVWGREFLSLEPETPRQIELNKHWYHWMLWGRLGYDPQLSNDRFVQILQARYPKINAQSLFDAWQHASMTYPVTTGFHWGALDFQWYIEACKSRPGPAQTKTGFHDVNRFITLTPHSMTGYMSIPDYVKSVNHGQKVKGLTPPAVAAKLHDHADKALALLDELDPYGHKELRHTLDDIRTMAYLGKYYACKINAAAELALYRDNKIKKHQQAAIEGLNNAAGYWRRYASQSLAQYDNPLWTNRVGFCDWRQIFEWVLNDIQIAGGTPDLKSMSRTPGGEVLRANEKGLYTYKAPTAGHYILEVRYAATQQRDDKIIINGQSEGVFTFWNTGGEKTYAWDRKTITLEKGDNTIRFEPLSTMMVPTIESISIVPINPLL